MKTYPILLKSLGLSLLLFIVALVLFCLLCPFGLLWALGTCIRERILKEFIIYKANIFFSIAFAIDLIGNVVLAPFLNRFFITKDSKYKFGSIKHTISLVLAYNYRENTLKKPGKRLYNILEWLDPGHCEVAIKDFENITFKNNKYNI